MAKIRIDHQLKLFWLGLIKNLFKIMEIRKKIIGAIFVKSAHSGIPGYTRNKLVVSKQTFTRYVTKIKNCSGFMRVDQFLKVWSLLSPKIVISLKQVELKRTTARIPTTPPIHNDPQVIFFSKAKFVESFEFFGKPASYPFRKVIYVPTKNFKLQSYST